MNLTRENPTRSCSALDRLCILPLLLIAIVTSIASDAWIEAVSTLITTTFGSD